MKRIGLILLTLLLSSMIWADGEQKPSEKPTLKESSGNTVSDSDLRGMLTEAWNDGYKEAARKLAPDLLAAQQQAVIERDLREAAEVQKGRAEAELWPWRIGTFAAGIVAVGCLILAIK